MEHLDPPEEAVWDERRLWFEAREAARAHTGAPAPSEQACALMIELQAVYCAGAWAAAVILAAAIVDAQAGEATGRRLRVSGLERDEARWLRDLRNRLVHEDRDHPVLTIEDHWMERGRWERDARRAVEAALAALYPAAAEAPPAARPKRRGDDR